MSYELSSFRLEKAKYGGITIHGFHKNDPANEEAITISLDTVDVLIAALKKLKDEIGAGPK